MSVFVHAQGLNTVHAGRGVKNWQNSIHLVVECPQSVKIFSEIFNDQDIYKEKPNQCSGTYAILLSRDQICVGRYVEVIGGNCLVLDFGQLL